MAVAFDAVGPSSAGATAGAGTTVSWSHTCTGSNRVLVVGAAVNCGSTQTITGVTYNGVAMTAVPSGRMNSNNTANVGFVQVWYLIAPATGANTVVITASASVFSFSAGSVSFTGVDQTTPLGAAVTSFGSSAAASVAVTGTTAGNIVIDAVCTGNAVSSSGQSLQWLRNTDTLSAAGNGASSTVAGGGTATMSYTVNNDFWGIVAVEVLAVPGAATPPPPWPLFVSDRGTVANVTAATTSVVTLTSPTAIAVGGCLIARVAVDNSGASGAAPGCTVTDARNTWTVLGPALADPGAAAAGATAYLCYARVVTAYQAADTLTFNWGGVSTTAKAVVVEQWDNISSITPVAVTAVVNDSGTAASTTAVSVAITPTATNQLVYTCLADEGIAGDAITYDADTTNGTWATLTRLASANATATNNQCVAGQYKQVTASGAQTWNATITSRDWAAIAVVFAPEPLPLALEVYGYAARVRAHYW